MLAFKLKIHENPLGGRASVHPDPLEDLATLCKNPKLDKGVGPGTRRRRVGVRKRQGGQFKPLRIEGKEGISQGRNREKGRVREMNIAPS